MTSTTVVDEITSVASPTTTTVQVIQSNSEPQIPQIPPPIPVKHKKKIRRPKPNVEEIEAICRICHEIVDPKDLGVVRACRCRNYLHQNCYQEWFKTAHTTNCEICLTNYQIRTRKRLNKTQLKQNWCNFFYYILLAFLFLILTGVTYFMDLKYLVIPPTNADYFYLNFIALTLAFFGSIYWIDGVFGFNRQQILENDLRWLPSCYENTPPTYPSFLAFQIHAIICPTTTDFCIYFGNICIGFCMIVGLLICAFLFGGLSFNNIIIMAVFVSGVVLALFLQCYCFSFLSNLKKTTMRQNIRNLLAIMGGQLLFHAIGMVVLKTLTSRMDLWLYMATQPQPNVFTCAIGGITWIVGLIILATLIKLVISLGQWVSFCCCPREIVPQLEPYQL